MSLPLQPLADRITELSAHLDAAKAQLIALIGEFDAAGGWADEGCRSCAHWLSWKCGVSPMAAREQVRVARALPGLPLMRAAFEAGRVSYSKVRAMTRVATPSSEAYLLMLAEHGTAAHVERVVRGVRQVRREREAREAGVSPRSALTYGYDEDGSLTVRVRLAPDAGARLVAAIERTVSELRRERAACDEAPDGRQPIDFDALRAEALLRLAEGDAPSTEVVVHVSAETLEDLAEADGSGHVGCCEVEGGSALPAESARRLACDASVVRLLEDAAGVPLDVGRRTRTIPPGLRRALAARDRGCRFPGCAATARVEGHHVKHWADGGSTALPNLVTLCRHHHRVVHEGGFTVEIGAGNAFRFLRPNGEEIVHQPPLAALDDCARRRLVEHNAARGLVIDATTGVSLWDGVGMDASMAVEGVLLACGELDG